MSGAPRRRQTAAPVGVGGGLVVISATAPTDPRVGQLWWDTVEEVLKVWNGSAWRNVGSGSPPPDWNNLLDANQYSLELGTTAGWTAASGAIHAVDEAGVGIPLPDGTWALGLERTTAAGSARSRTGLDGFEVVPGEHYMASFGGYGSGGGIQTFMAFYDASGTIIGSEQPGTTWHPINTAGWTEYVANNNTIEGWEAPAGSVTGSVRFRVTNYDVGGIAHFLDAIRVYRVGSVYGRLKLNVGTPEAPVWVREVCDDDLGLPAAATDNGWTIDPGPLTSATNGDTHQVTSPGTVTAGHYWQLTGHTGSVINTVGTNVNYTGVATTSGYVQHNTPGSSQTHTMSPSASGLTHWIIAGGASGTPAVTRAIFTAAEPVDAHPLKLNVGTPEAPDWVTVACMTPV